MSRWKQLTFWVGVAAYGLLAALALTALTQTAQAFGASGVLSAMALGGWTFLLLPTWIVYSRRPSRRSHPVKRAMWVALWAVLLTALIYTQLWMWVLPTIVLLASDALRRRREHHHEAEPPVTGPRRRRRPATGRSLVILGPHHRRRALEQTRSSR